LNVYFGVPGSGKTTYAAYLSKQCAYESIIIRLCNRIPTARGHPYYSRPAPMTFLLENISLFS